LKIVKDIFGNYLIVAPAVAWLAAQIIKVFTGMFDKRKFSLRTLLFSNGGMPSSHSAAVCALATGCVIKFGFSSFECAMSGIFAMIVMIDAAGVRYETGKQAKALNLIITELFNTDSEHADVHFKELIGHSPLQVLCGAITGVVTACLLYLIPAYSGIL